MRGVQQRLDLVGAAAFDHVDSNERHLHPPPSLANVIYGNTLTSHCLVNIPVRAVTMTRPVVAPSGTVAVISASEITLKELAGTPLKLTAVAPVRPEPRIWVTELTLPLETTNFTNGPRPTSKLNAVPGALHTE